MPRQISSIVTPDGIITAYFDGQTHSIPRDHPNYEQVKKAIKEDNVADLKKFVDIPQGVKNFSQGAVTVQNGIVFHNGQELHNAVTTRILDLMRDGYEFESMLMFLENLLKNISRRAVQELYNFLSHHYLPITEDGCFLAYKRVRDNWFDIYSGTIDNSLGKVVEVPRNSVDDDFRQGCSYGLHVGAIDYVRSYSGLGCENGGKVLIVKVNPADVVSVPSDSGETKCRVCKYTVIGLYTGNLEGSLYTTNGVRATPPPNKWEDAEKSPKWNASAADAVRSSLSEDEELLLEDEDEDEDDDYDDDDDDDDYDDDDYEDEPEPPRPVGVYGEM